MLKCINSIHFYISDHHGDWQILIGAPHEIALTAEYDLSLAIFDDGDITAQPKLLRKIASQSPNCQIIALSSSTTNCTWQKNIKSIFRVMEISIPGADPFYRVGHRFTVCTSFSDKIDVVATICDLLKVKKKKTILFAVSVDLQIVTHV